MYVLVPKINDIATILHLIKSYICSQLLHNMRFSTQKIIFTILILISDFTFASKVFSKILDNLENKKYQAIVLGKITESKVKNIGNYYITEYKLEAKEWLFKNSSIKKSNYLTIKILGAELPEKGIVIKASTAPDYIPIKKDAIFLLENTKKKDAFTISKNGILPKEDLEKVKKEI